MIVAGGTPSVIPVRVATYAGLPPTCTLSEVDPGRVETTVVQGFDPGVGGSAQPAIGAPARSGSHSTAAPSMVTLCCFGISLTWPPWTHMIVALLVTIGGTGYPLLICMSDSSS